MRSLVLLALVAHLMNSCNNKSSPEEKAAADSSANAQQIVVNNLDSLPAPNATKSVENHSKVLGWKNMTGKAKSLEGQWELPRPEMVPYWLLMMAGTGFGE